MSLPIRRRRVLAGAPVLSRVMGRILRPLRAQENCGPRLGDDSL